MFLKGLCLCGTTTWWWFDMGLTLWTELDTNKKKLGGLNFEALSKHGYRGGPSILKVPPPRINDKEQDWSWSTGRGSDASRSITEESFEEREHTRAAVAQGERLLNVTTSQQSDRKDKILSFSQKEKRKRDLGQASRGKSYVEEEKRLLRESGIYSGFDSWLHVWCHIHTKWHRHTGAIICPASLVGINIKLLKVC